jgi:hypothetical protein
VPNAKPLLDYSAYLPICETTPGIFGERWKSNIAKMNDDIMNKGMHACMHIIIIF